MSVWEAIKKIVLIGIILLLVVPLSIVLLLMVLFPREMNAVMTLQSASAVRGSASAIATRIGISAIAGPLGWFLIGCCIISLFIKGQHLQAVSSWVRGGERAMGPWRTVLLIWQAIPISWPISIGVGILGDLLTMNILHIPLVFVEVYRASSEAMRELTGGARSGYL